jgi:hypothetical protein
VAVCGEINKVFLPSTPWEDRALCPQLPAHRGFSHLSQLKLLSLLPKAHLLVTDEEKLTGASLVLLLLAKVSRKVP